MAEGKIMQKYVLCETCDIRCGTQERALAADLTKKKKKRQRAKDSWMALTSEHTPISAAEFTHYRLSLLGLHGEGLLLLLITYVL